MVKNVDDKKSLYEKYSPKDVCRIYKLKIRVVAVIFSSIIIMLGAYTIIENTSILLFYPECFFMLLVYKILILVFNSNLHKIVNTDCDPYKMIEVNNIFIEKYKLKKQTKRIQKATDSLYAHNATCYSIIEKDCDNAMEYIDKIDMNRASFAIKIMILNSKINIASLKHNQIEYEKVKKDYYEFNNNKKIPKRIAKKFEEQFNVNDLFFSEDVINSVKLSKEYFDKATYKQEKVAFAYHLYNLYKKMGKEEEEEKYRQYVIKYGYKYIEL